MVDGAGRDLASPEGKVPSSSGGENRQLAKEEKPEDESDDGLDSFFSDESSPQLKAAEPKGKNKDNKTEQTQKPKPPGPKEMPATTAKPKPKPRDSIKPLTEQKELPQRKENAKEAGITKDNKNPPDEAEEAEKLKRSM